MRRSAPRGADFLMLMSRDWWLGIGDFLVSSFREKQDEGAEADRLLEMHIPTLFHTIVALSAPSGSSPKGLCKRTGFLGVKRRENPVRRHFERSEMRGAAWRYCMKESGKERLKQVIYESTLSTAPRSAFPNGEGLGGVTLRVNLYKGRCPIKNHSCPFLWKGQTSEARRG